MIERIIRWSATNRLLVLFTIERLAIDALPDLSDTQVIGPDLRRGIAELDGTGEVAAGVVIMRQSCDEP